jgi:RNA polymerase sigma-70 factor, ECF subfamily
MWRRKLSSRLTGRLVIFAVTAPFIPGCTALPSTRQKNYLVSRGRRPPDSDVSSEDAEFYDGDHGLKDLESPERALLRDEIEGTVHRTIQQLPEDLRTALTLREFDGLSYEDIASVMQCPVGTVRSRIFRAREAIDKALQPLLQET